MAMFDPNSDIGRAFQQLKGGNPSNLKPDQLQALITREQYADYVRRFQPFEDQLYAELTPEQRAARLEQDLTTAGESVDKQFDASRGIMDRQMSRYGLSLNPDQRRSVDRSFGLQETLGKVGARNLTRRNAYETDMGAMRDLTQVGRDMATTASSAAGSAAGMQAQRDAANRSMKAQAKAQNMQDIGSLASLGMMAVMMSRRETKRGIKHVKAKDANRAIKKTDVKSFEYKPGLGMPKGRFMGPMADKAPKEFVDAKRTGTKPVNMVAAVVASQKDVLKRIEKLEKRHA